MTLHTITNAIAGGFIVYSFAWLAYQALRGRVTFDRGGRK